VAHAAVYPAHQPLRHQLGIDAGDFAQRTGHQQPRHADPEAAADQFHQQEAFTPSGLVPQREQRRAHRLGRRAAQRQDALVHPDCQAHIAFARWRRQNVGDGFGQVADRVIAFVEQPVVQRCPLDRVLAQQPGRHRLPRLAAGQKVDRPGGIGRTGACEIGLQRGQLAVGGGSRVQFGVEAGKLTHGGRAPCSPCRRRT
jgi:hypothetical protein